MSWEEVRDVLDEVCPIWDGACDLNSNVDDVQWANKAVKVAIVVSIVIPAILLFVHIVRCLTHLLDLGKKLHHFALLSEIFLCFCSGIGSITFAGVLAKRMSNSANRFVDAIDTVWDNSDLLGLTT